MEEIWKEITWTNGRYFVSNMGHVMSKHGRKKHCDDPSGIMKPKPHPNGYECVDLFVNRKYYRCYIHRLVMAAFIGDSEGRDVNHINGNKKDNRLSNLEYCTRKENMEHCYANNLRADVHKVAALRDGKVMFTAPFSRELAEQIKAADHLDTNIDTISRAIRKKSNTNLPYLGYIFVRF